MTYTVYDKIGVTERCKVKKLEYSGTWMGECFLTTDLVSPCPVAFAIGDYLDYRGERFEINYDPSVIKKARRETYGGAFTYEGVKFNSLSDELTRCDFLDYVPEDNNVHYSSLPKFSFFASDVRQLAERIQANLDRIYTGERKWTVEVSDTFEGNRDVNIQVDGITTWDALALANTKFGANFIIRGRKITIGSAGIPPGKIFSYGKGNGLKEVERTSEQDQKIVTRLRAYGSTRNLPERYYALLVNPVIETTITEVEYGYAEGETLVHANVKLPFDLVFKGTELYPVTIDGVSYQIKSSSYEGQGYVPLSGEPDKEHVKAGASIRLTTGIVTTAIPPQYKQPSGEALPENMYVSNLMLPGFPTETRDPYIDSKNLEALGIREGTVYFDGSSEDFPEIYPSLEGMTAEDLKAAGISVASTGALDEVNDAEQLTDNGAPDENGEIAKGTFLVTLKDLGFDPNDYLTSETATLSMKSGKCAGREFEITECVKHGDYYRLTCRRTLDESLRLFFPYKDYNIEAGDKFVLLNITMPDVYIQAASERLKQAAEEWLSKNDYARYSYSPSVDNVYMARQHAESQTNGEASLHDTLKEGDILLFEDEDLGIEGSITIDSLSIREGYGPIPEYEITLREEKVTGTLDRIQQQIDSIAGGQGGGGGYNSTQIQNLIRAYGARMFLSKIKEDSTPYLVKFLKGLESGTYNSGLSGAKIDGNGDAELESLVLRKALKSFGFTTGALGSGFFFGLDDNGDSYIEADRMLIRKVATFVQLLIQELKHVGGQVVLTPASMQCSRVEEYDDYYRCFFETTDGERTINQEFVTGDQARCQTFNVKEGVNENVSNTYYWRLVTGIGDDYIDLSKSDCDAGSTVPQAGDDIVQLGNRDDVTRQTAIVLSSYGNDAPYIKMYRGINSYSLTGKEFFTVSRTAVDITADVFRLSTGENITEEITSIRGDVEQAKQEAEQAAQNATEAQEQAQGMVEELDRLSSDDYISPVEKTALRQQQADIVAEYAEIIAQANQYGVATTAFANAYRDADEALDHYTAQSPEYIPVGSDYDDIAAYYEARQTILNAIAEAAKQYVDDQGDAITTKVTETVMEAVEGQITLAVKTEVNTVLQSTTFNFRNLVQHGKYGIEGSTDYLVKGVTLYEELEIGKTYTIVMSGEVSSGQHFAFYDSAAYTPQCDMQYGEHTGRIFKRSFTYSPHSSTPNHAQLNLYNYPNTSNNPCDVDWVCIYEGEVENYPDYFIPAYEDSEDDIASIRQEITSEINVLEGQIALKVSETDVTTMLNGYVQTSTFNSQITQLSNQISLKVSATEMNQAIDDALANFNPTGVHVLIDATGLNENRYYPVTVALNQTGELMCNLTVSRPLSEDYQNGGLSYSTHNSGGFVLIAEWQTNANGWGSVNVQRRINNFTVNWASGNVFGNIGQITEASTEYFYVRGGSKYDVWADGAVSSASAIELHRSGFSNSYQNLNILSSVTPPETFYSETTSEIQLLNDEIELRVTQTEFDSLGNRVSEAESLIEQTSDAISMKVWQSDIDDAVADMYGLHNLVKEGNYGIVDNKQYYVKEADLYRDLGKGSKYTAVISGSLSSGNSFHLYDSMSSKDLGTFSLHTTGIYKLVFTYNPSSSVTNNKKVRIYNAPNGSSRPCSINWFAVFEGELKTIPTYFIPADEESDWNQSFNAIKESLQATGIDIDARTVTVTASSFRVQNNYGTPIAVFTTDSNGNPVLQAPYIDVDNLEVRYLEGANGTFDLITFQDSGTKMSMGANVFDTTQNLSPLVIEISRSKTSGFNAGITFNVTGMDYDQGEESVANYGNHAILAHYGDICGFRLKTRQFTATQYLTDYDSIVFCTNANNITLYLPSQPQRGQIYFIRKCAAGNVTLSGTIRTSFSGGNVSSVTIKNQSLHILMWNGTARYWTCNSIQTAND